MDTPLEPPPTPTPPPLPPVDAPAALPGGTIDAAGMVAADVPCRRCGYNVRGLQITGLCPECATPVGLSVQGDLLRFADPAWLDRLARGAGLAFWGALLGVGVAILVGAIAFVLGPLIAQLIGLAGGVVYLFGVWLLSEPDPSGLGEDRYGTARKVIRVGLVAGVVHALLEVSTAVQALAPVMRMSLTAAGLAAALVQVVGDFALLHYLRRLAMRLPDLALAGRARVLFWGYGISYAVLVVLGGIVAVLVYLQANRQGGGPSDALVMALVVPAALAGLALLVFWIMLLVLFYRLRHAFRTQAALVRHAWSAGNGGQPPAAG